MVVSMNNGIYLNGISLIASLSGEFNGIVSSWDINGYNGIVFYGVVIIK